MTTITLSIAEDRLPQIQEAAARLGVSLEDLVRAGIEEVAEHPGGSFELAAARVLEKNDELYRRLA